MNSYQILLNKNFTGATPTINSTLEFDGDYLVYLNRNGGGLVNAFNVRGYLNDSRNQQIINDFFNYLTGNTTQAEALNIIQSDQKLSDVFNSYYQNFILSSSSFSNTATIDANLTGTSLTAYTEFFHPWIGQSENRQLTGITESIINSVFSGRMESVVSDYTDESSYYIPVNLKRSFEQIPRLIYEPCDPIINQKTQAFYPQYSAITQAYFTGSTSTGNTLINSLINCFVDLNLETNEQAQTPTELLTVSFETDNKMVAEGDQLVKIKVSLNKPSVSGFEEATINLIPYATNFGIDFTSPDSYPLTLSWAVGEQDKFLTFNINNDYEEELLEPFLLQIAGFINLNPGPILNETVFIQDRTNLNYVSLERALYPPDNSGVTHLITDENNDIDFSIKLDHPAFGVEKVVLEKVSILNTINGAVGPAAFPLLPSEYVLVKSVPGGSPIVITTPYTVSFNAGETSQDFLLYVKDNNVINEDKIAYFDLSTAQFCIIDQSKKMLEITARDDDGKYKYVHLNLGTIYNEFGNSISNTLMRQISPQAGIGGSYNNIQLNNYSNYIIEYGSDINFQDYSQTGTQNINFKPAQIRVRITNTGTFQGIVNNIALAPGASTTIVIPGNNYIITTTTNSNQDTTTQYFETAKYKVELIDTYSATLQSGVSISGFNPFSLRALDNTQSTNGTILIGDIALQGYQVAANDTTKSYKLKSYYRDINTGRILNNLTLTCPIVNTTSNSVSYSEFYASKIEDISVFGIILLNYNDAVGNPANGGLYGSYVSGNSTSKYNGFEFVGFTQAQTLTCSKTASDYNDLHYYNLPFTVESTPTFWQVWFTGLYDRLYNFQIENKGLVSVRITNTLSGPIKLASTGVFYNPGQVIILAPNDTISIPNPSDEPAGGDPNAIVAGNVLLLPGNSNYDSITNKYTTAVYKLRPVVAGNFGANNNFNTGADSGVSHNFDNNFIKPAYSSGFIKTKFQSQSDVSQYGINGIIDGIRGVGATGPGNTDDLIDILFVDF